MTTLKPVFEAIQDIASTSSRTIKENKIKKYVEILGDPFIKTLQYALDPLKQFNTTTVPGVKKSFLRAKDYQSIFDHLDIMASRRGADNSIVQRLGQLSGMDDETLKVVRLIVNKDLRCGVGIKTAKKYIPGLEEHEVSLCGAKQFILENENGERHWDPRGDLDEFVRRAGGWQNVCASVKKDGVRNWAISKGDGLMHVSRNGKEYENFHILDEEIERFLTALGNDFTLDGEVTSGQLGFQKLSTQLQRISELDPSMFRFEIFDLANNLSPYSDRYKLLVQAVQYGGPFEILSVLPHTRIYNKEHCFNMAMQEIAKGEEGLVLQVLSAGYEPGYNWNMCKIKPRDSVDLKVIGTYMGKGRLSNTLGGLIVDFNGVEVRVGSGYTDRDRTDLLETPPKMIEVAYQGVTDDGSLRFPIFIRVRDDKS